MPQQEFEAYMNGEITSVSAWESALVACEGMHQLCEHLSLLKDLSQRTTTVQDETQKLTQDILKFKDEINEKVISVLEKTPLIIKPRKTPEDLKIEASQIAAIKIEVEETQPQTNFYLQNLQIGQNNLGENKTKLQLDITSCMDKQQSLEFLSPAFESLEGATPDDQNSLSLSKINYDIDFSDLSGENSVAELTPEKRKSPSFTPDPFSPVGSSCTITQVPLVPSQVESDFVLPFVEGEKAGEETLLEKEDEAANLPSPIKPMTSQYSGFSKQGWQIPSIPCITGDLASSNASQSNSQASTSHDN